jgi:hypothetical protein
MQGDNHSVTPKRMFLLLYFSQKSTFIWTQHMHLKPELNGSTTWASHMKNMEEETWPGRSDSG